MIFLYLLWKQKTFMASLSHALMASIFTFMIYGMDDEYHSDIAKISLINSFIYFFSDMFFRFNWEKFFHHIISAISCLIALYSTQSIQIFTAETCGILEIANPYWTTFRLRLEKSDEIVIPEWYDRKISGVMFMISFFITRFIWLPWVLYTRIPPEIPILVFCSMSIPFMILSSHWMILLIRGFIREILGKENAIRNFSCRICSHILCLLRSRLRIKY